MKNFLFLTLLNITFVVSPFLTTAPFFATTHAQALPPCSAIIPNDTNCIDFDGTVRPGTGGGEEEVSPSDNDEEINPGGGEEVVGISNPIGPDDIQELLAIILSSIVQIAIPFLVLAIMWVGFLFVAARGNPEKLSAAKQALWYTLLGALIILGAQTLSVVLSGTIRQLTE